MQWCGGRKSEGHTALEEERQKMDRDEKLQAASVLTGLTENLNLRVYPTSSHDAPNPTQTKLTNQVQDADSPPLSTEHMDQV